MNSETRMPASRRRCTKGRSCATPPTTSSPPSVVTQCASRAPGHAACGLCWSADRQHLVGRRHLEIERHLEIAHEPCDVVVDDVAAILAQMRGDAVGAGRHREQRRAHRIRMPARRARYAPSRHVDIDAETQLGCMSAAPDRPS